MIRVFDAGTVVANFIVDSIRLFAQTYTSDQAIDDFGLDPHLAIVDRLADSTVVVIGIGGVGSWAAEALCRSGVGNLILIDLDDICISNTNRQLHATSSTVGKLKIDEMKRRLLDINPDCNVTNIHDFVSALAAFKYSPDWFLTQIPPLYRFWSKM